MTDGRALPSLYAIIDVDVCQRARRSAGDIARACVAGGARLLQLRAKSLSSGAALALAVELVEVAHAAGARLVVNDRADLACLAGADGVHVGQDDLPPAAVRQIVGEARLVGLSTHTADQVERAVVEPISYLAIGPVFDTATKRTGYDAVGLTMVTAAARRATAHGLPVVAIGGITLATARSVIAAGAASVAVITDLLTADPEARVREYVAALAGGTPPGPGLPL